MSNPISILIQPVQLIKKEVITNNWDLASPIKKKNNALTNTPEWNGAVVYMVSFSCVFPPVTNSNIPLGRQC